MHCTGSSRQHSRAKARGELGRHRTRSRPRQLLGLPGRRSLTVQCPGNIQITYTLRLGALLASRRRLRFEGLVPAPMSNRHLPLCLYWRHGPQTQTRVTVWEIINVARKCSTVEFTIVLAECDTLRRNNLMFAAVCTHVECDTYRNYHSVRAKEVKRSNDDCTWTVEHQTSNMI